jgi:hypothetical protein
MSNYKPSFNPNQVQLPYAARWKQYLTSKLFTRSCIGIGAVTFLVILFQQGYMLGMNRGVAIANRAAASTITAIKQGYCPK